jgi:polar amino acid transport system substrate-binding protein
MKKTFLCVAVLFFSCVAAAQSTLEQVLERGQLRVGTSGNMPTMSMSGEGGRVEGFDIDMARLMADAMGVELAVNVMPFPSLIPALESGEVDVVLSNMTINPTRNLRVAFVGPYLESGKCIVAKRQALAQANEQSTDLNSPETRLAVMAGSTSETFARELFPQGTVVTIDSYQVGAELVAKDEASGMLTDYPICLATLKENPDAGFVSLFSLLTYEPIGVALPGGDAQFINWTNNFMNRLDGTNTFKALGERWFGRASFAKTRE